MNKRFWSQLCFVAPPKLSAIIIVANIMCRCHGQHNSNRTFPNTHSIQGKYQVAVERHRCHVALLYKCMEEKKIKMKIKNYKLNDHLFKLNRSTKSSAWVNCLQSALFHFVDGDSDGDRTTFFFILPNRYFIFFIAYWLGCNNL